MKRSLLVLLLLLTGCGYALVGRSNFLDPKIRTVYVYRGGTLARLVKSDEQLTSELLPGFALALLDLFI